MSCSYNTIIECYHIFNTKWKHTRHSKFPIITVIPNPNMFNLCKFRCMIVWNEKWEVIDPKDIGNF